VKASPLETGVSYKTMSNHDRDDKYIVSLRGTLERAPANAPDAESVFRAERALNASEISGGVVIPKPSTDAYSPYAEKWKEFDKLEKLAKGNKARWFELLWGVIFPAIGILDRHRVSRKDTAWLFALGAAIAVAGVLRAWSAKQRFAHWPCPRCGAEWPGTKTEKDPRCAMCGLELHQITP